VPGFAQQERRRSGGRTWWWAVVAGEGSEDGYLRMAAAVAQPSALEKRRQGERPQGPPRRTGEGNAAAG